MATADQLKSDVRERVWTQLEAAGAAVGAVHGKIPDFTGAGQAALRLAELAEWKSAHTVKVTPDRPQQPVLMAALSEGKIVYMAVPKLASEQPFVILDPGSLGSSINDIATNKDAVRLGMAADVTAMNSVDIIVCGSVAVSTNGGRLGKGAGYADIEVALLTMAGLIGPSTVIATTVHDLQVVDGELPELEHDFGVDLIVTPTRVIRCDRQRRPAGINWAQLPPGKVATIPVLARMEPDRP